MPPKQSSVGKTIYSGSNDLVTEENATDLILQVAEVMVDLEETFKRDPKAMAVIKPRYKKSGVTFSVRYRDDWSDYDGENALAALLQYHAEVLRDETPPPPLKGGRATT